MSVFTALFLACFLLNVESIPVKLWKLKDSNLDKARDQSPIIILFQKNDTNGTLFHDGLKEAIKRMEKFGVNAGEINCTEYARACKNKGVKKNSVLRYYPRRGQYDYTGEATEDGIYEWMEKNTKKSLRIFRKLEEVEALFPELETVFIGYFTDRKNIEFQTYESCASSPKDNSLFTAVIDKNIEDVGIEYRQLNENWRDEFNGQWDWGELTRWIGDVQSPFVDEITSESAERYAKSNSPIGYIIYDGKQDDQENIRKIGTQLGKKYRNQMIFVLLDHSKHWKVTKTLGLDEHQLPGFTIVSNFESYLEVAKAHYPLLYTPGSSYPVYDNTNFTYTITDEKWKDKKSAIDITTISQHVDAFLQKRLPLLIRSESSSITEESKKEERSEITVTGSTFNSTVLDLDHDVFLLVHAPWSSKSKTLLKNFRAIASEVQRLDEEAEPENKSTLIFADMDATENDIWPYYYVDDYPTLLLFPKGDKMKTIRCEEITSVEKIKRFLKQNAKSCPLVPNQEIIDEEDARDKRREKMEKKMGIDRSNKKKKYLFEDEL